MYQKKYTIRLFLLFIFALSILSITTKLLAYEPEVVSWENAHKYYGQYVTVEGQIVDTHNSGKACFLNFHPDWKKHFTAVIFSFAFPKFPPHPEKFYEGKKVRVTGKVKEYQGKPEIILEDPSQIKIISTP